MMNFDRSMDDFFYFPLNKEKKSLNNIGLIIMMSLLFFGVIPRGQAHSFNEIISFGDSLTDIGNVSGLTQEGSSPVIDGYYKETHFCDNVLWVEQLAEYWELPTRTPGRGGTTSLSPQPLGNTWAWGGSEASDSAIQPPGVTELIPNLLTEVSEYLNHNEPNNSTLFAIWSGANNLLEGRKFGPLAAIDAVNAVTQSMIDLEQRGARHFLIFNLPKLGDTPKGQSDIWVRDAADIYSLLYNIELKEQLRKFRRDRNFKGRIYLVDTYTKLKLIVDTVNSGETYTPTFFVPGPPVSITNVRGMALDVFNETGTYPNNYLFWDDLHPTTVTHQIIVGLILQAIQAR